MTNDHSRLPDPHYFSLYTIPSIQYTFYFIQPGRHLIHKDIDEKCWMIILIQISIIIQHFSSISLWIKCLPGWMKLGTRSFFRGSLSAPHSISSLGSLTLMRSFFELAFSLVAQTLVAQPVVRGAKKSWITHRSPL